VSGKDQSMVVTHKHRQLQSTEDGTK